MKRPGMYIATLLIDNCIHLTGSMGKNKGWGG